MRSLASISILAAAALVCVCASEVSAQSAGSVIRTIVLDPGHGGEDAGATAGEHRQEKHLNLALANRLRDRIERELPGVEVILTREDDRYLPLEERTAIANRADADLFLSIHCNAATNPSAHGVETYYLDPAGTAPGELVPGREETGPALPVPAVAVAGQARASVIEDLVRVGAGQESAYLAELVQSSLIEETSARDRDVRQAQFRVLRGARMPALVLEVGFVSHKIEGPQLEDASYQERIATGVVRAIAAYDGSRSLARAELRVPREEVDGRQPRRVGDGALSQVSATPPR